MPLSCALCKLFWRMRSQIDIPPVETSSRYLISVFSMRRDNAPVMVFHYKYLGDIVTSEMEHNYIEGCQPCEAIYVAAGKLHLSGLLLKHEVVSSPCCGGAKVLSYRAMLHCTGSWQSTRTAPSGKASWTAWTAV